MAPIFEQTSEWNLLAALIIGIAFGFVLERAGFSTSRKLAGVFYGYDFTVLKVFFTAAFTAAAGLLYLNYFGIFEFEKVWMPTTYLTPTIVGGAIMGVGFIMGGFCPGTSLCGIATGKIDAFVFVIGIAIGVLFYGLTYEAIWEDFRLLGNIGKVKIGDLLGISPGIAVFIFIMFGLVVFWLVDKIKKEYKIQDVDY
jgi:hypothetical protein